MNNQLVIVCPGIHELDLTQEFIASLINKKAINWQFLVFPTQDYPAYSAIHIMEFLRGEINNIKQPIAFISFSAGVVGAIGAASAWQLLGGTVKRLIAIDGWGVPLVGSFPIHRLSHDYFTHWSSALLGSGEASFYADPAVEHLQLWKSPDSCKGWLVEPVVGGKSAQRNFTTAAEFILQLLQI